MPGPRKASSGRAHSPTRETLLRLLEAQQGPVSVATLSEATGWHENTVRGHLTALWSDGYLTRTRDVHTVKGRPSWLWSVSLAAPVSPYSALAGALASALVASSPDPEAAAYEAGKAWGRTLSGGPVSDGEAPGRGSTPTPPPGGHSDRHTPASPSHTHEARATRDGSNLRRAVIETMREQGFAPETHDDGSIVLRQCPLIEAASGHSNVVCAVHLGMVAGTLKAFGATDGGSTLTPFTAPGECTLRLRVAA